MLKKKITQYLGIPYYNNEDHECRSGAQGPGVNPKEAMPKKHSKEVVQPGEYRTWNIE